MCTTHVFVWTSLAGACPIEYWFESNGWTRGPSRGTRVPYRGTNEPFISLIGFRVVGGYKVTPTSCVGAATWWVSLRQAPRYTLIALFLVRVRWREAEYEYDYINILLLIYYTILLRVWNKYILNKLSLNSDPLSRGVGQVRARVHWRVRWEKTFRVEELVLVVVFTLSLKELLAYLNINIEK